MIASYLSFSYYYFDGWWYSGLGTLLIVFFAFRIWPADFLTQTGLKISARKLMYSLILVVILSTGAYILMKSIASENGITIQYETFTNYIHDIFYTLNEEIVLGAVLLGIIRRKFTTLHPAMISLLVAVIFMIFHYIFYRWIFTDSGILMVSTLTSLLFVGILRNNLILFTGHVGYAWAFHASWMAVMFGCNHLYTTDGQLLSELERFNLYLGSPKILPLIAILMLITLYSIIRKN
ncbi:MAG: hypothetical protein JSV24_02505, partial [Bacteroidales bacterium]